MWGGHVFLVRDDWVQLELHYIHTLILSVPKTLAINIQLNSTGSKHPFDVELGYLEVAGVIQLAHQGCVSRAPSPDSMVLRL